MPTPPFAAVVFDNDGLLLDTEVAWTRAEEVLFQRYGSTFTPGHKREMIGSSGEKASGLLEGWLGQDGRALLTELQGLVMDEAREPVPARPGALALIERLRAAGIPIGVASNSERPFVERVLGNAGLLGDGSPFDVVVSASDVEQPKPAPDVYLAACVALGADPTACAALEDSPTGAQAARAAGMFVIGVPYFADGPMPDVDLVAPSLADPTVAAALGVAKGPGSS